MAGARASVERASEAWIIAEGTSQHFYLHVLPSYHDLYEGNSVAVRERLRQFVTSFRRSPLGQVVAQECQLRFLRALAELGCEDAHGLRVAGSDARFLGRSGLAYGRVTAALLRASIAARHGDLSRKAKELSIAVAESDANALGVLGACAALELSSLAAIDEREAVRNLALMSLREQGVLAPERLAKMFIPF